MHLLLLRTRKGCKHAVTGFGFDYRRTISIKGARERSPPSGSNSKPHHSPPGLFNCWIGHNYPIPCMDNFRMERGDSHHFPWRQMVCYSGIFNYSFHFGRLWTCLYGIRIEKVCTYTVTYYFITGCFLNS